MPSHALTLDSLHASMCFVLFHLVAAFSFAAESIIAYEGRSDTISRSFQLSANGISVPVVEMPAMTEKERQQLADVYLKMPSYCHIDDPSCMHLHYAHLAATGRVEIEINAVEDIQTFRLHPLRWKIPAHVQGSVLQFISEKRHQPRYYIVRINHLPPLMIVVDPPETMEINKNDPHVLDASPYLTDSSGVNEQTEAILRAFADANGTGRTVYLPPGVYLTDQLHIKGGHHFSIYLAPGCLLKVKYSSAGENNHRHGLWLDQCRDVTVFGRGIIDHQAYEHYVLSGNNYQHGMIDYYTCNTLTPWITQSPLFLTGCQRILIEGITLRNGRNFNLNARQCDHLTIRRVKIFTPPACTPEYADGINTGSCRDVLIENCLVACNDDCFASGHYFSTYDHRSSQDHVIRGMLGWNMRANAVRLGFFTNFDQGDFTFDRCHFVAMPFGAVLIHGLGKNADGQVAHYGRIHLIDCSFDDAPRLRSLFKVEKASIKNLTLEKVSYHGPPPSTAGWQIEGDPSAPIQSLQLERVTVNGERVNRLDQPPSFLRNVVKYKIK